MTESDQCVCTYVIHEWSSCLISYSFRFKRQRERRSPGDILLPSQKDKRTRVKMFMHITISTHFLINDAVDERANSYCLVDQVKGKYSI